MNVIMRLEFELSYFETAETPLPIPGIIDYINIY